jgi:hypothetical protein
MMLERRIYEALDQGRQHINDDPSFIVQFFCGMGLAESEAKEIRDFWLKQEFYRRSLDNTAYETVVGVNISHQFPRQQTDKQFPGWFIVLMDEKEHDDKGRYLGDELDDVTFDGRLTSLTGSIKQKTFGVFTYTVGNPDVCIYYYELCKFFLTRARQWLKSADIGVLDSAFSGGDMMPDPQYAPEHMFVRRFTIEAKVLEGVEEAGQPDRAFKVGGAYVRNPEGLDVVTDGVDQDGVPRSINPQVTPIGDDE